MPARPRAPRPAPTPQHTPTRAGAAIASLVAECSPRPRSPSPYTRGGTAPRPSPRRRHQPAALAFSEPPHSLRHGDPRGTPDSSIARPAPRPGLSRCRAALLPPAQPRCPPRPLQHAPPGPIPPAASLSANGEAALSINPPPRHGAGSQWRRTAGRKGHREEGREGQTRRRSGRLSLWVKPPRYLGRGGAGREGGGGGQRSSGSEWHLLLSHSCMEKSCFHQLQRAFVPSASLPQSHTAIVTAPTKRGRKQGYSTQGQESPL